ncbi:MAG: YHS domain-containing protein [Gammaproteobacteria bacterium]|nr:YHS domain-containing protein [Gammaproteobacteria bacterium]
MNRRVKDPVCGMEVDPHDHALVYLQMHFAFCSRQCRERFLANPHLYIGSPGHPSPKQEGLEIVKRRRLRVATPLSPDAAALLVEALQTLMGIRAVHAEGDRVEITYDLLQATQEQIEAKMAEVGVRLGEGWADRLRRAFVNFEEESQVGGLAGSGTHCGK